VLPLEVSKIYNFLMKLFGKRRHLRLTFFHHIFPLIIDIFFAKNVSKLIDTSGIEWLNQGWFKIGLSSGDVRLVSVDFRCFLTERHLKTVERKLRGFESYPLRQDSAQGGITDNL